MRENIYILTLLKSVFFLVVLASANLEASECTVMQYLDNKSRGVEMIKNSCLENNQVSIGASFELTPGARLWLRSYINSGTDRHFQLICQNRASHSVKVEVSSIHMPWIRPDGLTNCKAWNDNKLTCDDNSGNKNGFFCVIASIKNPNFSKQKQVERTTSVKMRKIFIGETGYAYFKDVIDIIKPEINLCRQLHSSTLPVKVQWNVNDAGKVENIIVNQPENAQGQHFSECVQTVVDHFDYPLLTKDSSFSHQF